MGRHTEGIGEPANKFYINFYTHTRDYSDKNRDSAKLKLVSIEMRHEYRSIGYRLIIGRSPHFRCLLYKNRSLLYDETPPVILLYYCLFDCGDGSL